MKNAKKASDLILCVIPSEPHLKRKWIALSEESLLGSRKKYLLILDDGGNFVAYWSKTALLRAETQKELAWLYDEMLHCAPDGLMEMDREARQLERQLKIYEKLVDRECLAFG